MEIDCSVGSGYVVQNKSGPRANHNRGYHDMLQVITIWNMSEDVEKKIVDRLHKDLQGDGFYMWVYNPKQIQKPGKEFPYISVYEINYGYDSGD